MSLTALNSTEYSPDITTDILSSTRSKRCWESKQQERATCRIEVFGSGAIKVKYETKSTSTVSKKHRGSKKQPTTNYNHKIKKSAEFAAYNFKNDMRMLLTLTYPYQFKVTRDKYTRDRKVFVQRLEYRGIDFFAVLEFNELGMPHFHVAITKLLTEEEINDLSEAWFEIVGSNNPAHLKYGLHAEPVPEDKKDFFIQYLLKEDQKVPPSHIKHPGKWWTCSKKYLKPVKVYEASDNNRIKMDMALQPAREQKEFQLRQSLHRMTKQRQSINDEIAQLIEANVDYDYMESDIDQSSKSRLSQRSKKATNSRDQIRHRLNYLIHLREKLDNAILFVQYRLKQRFWPTLNLVERNGTALLNRILSMFKKFNIKYRVTLTR